MSEFSFFDQYQDMEIDLTDYLKKVSESSSATDYQYNFSNMQPVKVAIKNLFTKYEIITDFKKNVDLLIYYNVQDNETIEQVSYNNYETTEYWWLIALFNNITNIFLEWPMNQDQLNAAVDLLYNEEGKYNRMTYFNMLFEKNELRRELIIPKSFVINEIIWKYREAILAG